MAVVNSLRCTVRLRFAAALQWTLALVLLTALEHGWAAAGPFRIELNTNNQYGNPPVNQNNVPAANGGGGVNSCAPTAVANSLSYLTNAFPDTYRAMLLQDKPSATGAANPQQNNNAGWTAIATQLASNNYMRTSSTTGTTQANIIAGTKNYINNNAPGTTIFEQANNPSANFLLKQLVDREDLEIGILPINQGIGHILTVTSMEGQTNNAGIVTSANIDGVDPGGGTFNLALGNVAGPGPLTVTYNGAQYRVAFGFAESPVPEPSTMVLTMMAAGTFAAHRLLRRRLTLSC